MNKQLQTKYLTEINLITTIRLRLALIVAIVLYLSFFALDFFIYGNYPLALFFIIRLAVTAGLLAIYCLTLLSNFTRYAVWLCIFVGIFTAGGICLMINITEGSVSPYYQGLNLVVIGMFMANSFRTGYNIVIYVGILAMYVIATLLSPATVDLFYLFHALFFLTSTMIFMAIIGNLYANQYEKEFVIREKLRESEEKLERSYEAAKTEAEIDGLTQTFNRKHFIKRLERRITKSIFTDEGFYFIIFDIDHFKDLNDTLGHTFGDAVLKKIIKTVKQSVREGTDIGRYGGDEFMMLFGDGEPEQIVNRLISISDVIKNLSFEHDGKKIKVSASFGVSQFVPGKNISPKKLIKTADAALLEVKQTEKGGILFKEC